jgi:hypothetical protein
MPLYRILLWGRCSKPNHDPLNLYKMRYKSVPFYFNYSYLILEIDRIQNNSFGKRPFKLDIKSVQMQHPSPLFAFGNTATSCGKSIFDKSA